MTLDDIEEALNAALKLRSPCFMGRPQISGREKVAELESYMLFSSHVNGDLVEARHWLRGVEEKLADEWAGLQGWEVALKRPRAKATKEEIEQAKISVAPALHAAGRKARRLRESVVDQIQRLEREEKVVSRAYTMVSGG